MALRCYSSREDGHPACPNPTPPHDLLYLLYDLTDGISVVTINRPDKLNALNDQVITDWEMWRSR